MFTNPVAVKFTIWVNDEVEVIEASIDVAEEMGELKPSEFVSEFADAVAAASLRVMTVSSAARRFSP